MANNDIGDIFDAAAGTPDPVEDLKHDQKDIKDIFQQAHDAPSAEEIQAKAQSADPYAKQRADFNADLTGLAHGLTGGLTGVAAGVGAGLGSLSGGGDFGSAYKEGVEGEKARQKAAHDQNPTGYNVANFMGAIPTMAVGGGALQDLGVASKVGQGAALGAGLGESSYLGQNADPSLAGAAGSAALGAGLGAAGGKLGEALTYTPEELANKGSNMAMEAMGMNSSKDLTTQFNPMTQQVERGSQIIKGTGTTALDQGILKGGQSGWYDNAINALKSNYQKLPPLFQSAQSKIDQNLPAIMDDVGAITTKTPDTMQKVFDSVPQTSQRLAIVRKLQQQYTMYEQKLAAADGNLQQLNEVKQELTTAAQNLKPQIYNNGSASAEADLYKNLGGVVRQHIEDLASAADPGAGDAIHQVNKTIGNLSSMLPSLQKATRGGIPTSWSDLGQMIAGPIEKYAGKTLNAASDVNTPIGTLVQKVIPTAPKAIMTNPWSQQKIQNKTGITNTQGSNPAQNVTRTAANLYNATPDSLSDVAEKLQKQAGMTYMGQYLKKAVDDDDQDAKNRAIFALMQNPSARALLTPDEDENG